MPGSPDQQANLKTQREPISHKEDLSGGGGTTTANQVEPLLQAAQKTQVHLSPNLVQGQKGQAPFTVKAQSTKAGQLQNNNNSEMDRASDAMTKNTMGFGEQQSELNNGATLLKSPLPNNRIIEEQDESQEGVSEQKKALANLSNFQK